MELGLTNAVVIVTGGAKGIGEGIVRQFAAEGARVIAVGRGLEAGQQLVATLADSGRTAEFIEAELTDESDIKRSVGSILARYGGIDVLVNNAGVNDGVGLERPPGEFMASIRRNLFHVFAMTHYALDSLKLRRGCIVNIGSKVAETGQGGTSGYAASKGGVNALTREWALDLAPAGVRVNAVIPAEVMTPLYEAWLSRQPDPRAMLERIESLIPLGRRMTTKEEIASMVVFLASPRSSHTTGQIIHVDGGYVHFDRKH